MLEKQVLSKFTKDFNLPIKVFEKEYFDYYIELYDAYLNTKKHYSLLENCIARFNGSANFFGYYNQVKEEIINHIKAKDGYINFTTMNMNKFKVNNEYNQTSIYNNLNDSKYYLSIDLVKANFQALKYIDESIFDNSNSYSEFIHLFTDEEYILSSKQFRQVLFGNLAPKRLAKVERYLIEQIIKYLLEANIITKENIVSVNTDELIIEVDSNTLGNFSNENILNLVSSIKYQLGIDVDIELFQLKVIKDSFFVKEFINKDGYELKGVSALLFPQVYKYYNNLEINDNDLVFKHEHMMAKFCEPLFK